MSRKEREGGKRKLRTRQIRQNKKHRIHDTCREVNHFLSILAIPLLSILLLVFFRALLDIICCDFRGGKQGVTHATTWRLRHSGCWCKVVRSACLCPAVLLCCVCGCGRYVVYICSVMGWRGVVAVPASPWQTCGNLSVIGNR